MKNLIAVCSNLLHVISSTKKISKSGKFFVLGTILLFCLIFSTGYKAKPALDPILDSLEVAPGLALQLFAAEPMLVNPTNIDIDAKGRVWVCEAVNYRPETNNARFKGRPEGDRILILEDTDGDGKADKQTVFYQGKDVDAALGICVLGNKVIVSASPNVIVLTDTDGDGKADKKELMFTGIGGIQSDHGLHSFTFGPDGKLYFNYGNLGYQIMDKHGNHIKDQAGNVIDTRKHPYRDGMVFRCDTDGTNIEVLAYNFRNNYEVAVDSYGSLWQSDNDDDGNRSVRINYLMPYGNFGYKDELTGASWRTPRTNMEKEIPNRHWHQNDPGVIPNLLITGAGAPTGILVNEGSLLPSIYKDQIVLADAGVNDVKSYPVKQDGAGFKAGTLDLLKTRSDKHFRPSDVCIAPDGSLFVADWYDAAVGGHQMWDIAKGRIFRVTTPAATPYTIPKLNLNTPEDAVNALKSPNLATRYLAWKKLNDWGGKAEPVLAKMFKSDTNPRFRARALWLLSKLDHKASEKYIDLAAHDTSYNIRITAIRAAAEVNPVITPLLSKLAKDKSPQVRSEVAIHLRYDKTDDAASIWATIANQADGKDRWYLEALGIGAEFQWERFLGAWYKQVNHDVNNKAYRDIIWRARTPLALSLLPEIITSSAISSSELPRYFRALDYYPESSEKQQILISLINSSKSHLMLVNSLALAHIDPIAYADNPKVKEALPEVLKTVKGQLDYVMLINRYKLKGHDQDLLHIVLTQPDKPAGIEASKVLIYENPSLLLKSINEKDENAQAILLAFNSTVDLKVQDLFVEMVLNDKLSLSARKLALKFLGRNSIGEDRILNLLKNKKFNSEFQQISAYQLSRSIREPVRKEAAQYLTSVAEPARAVPSIDRLMALVGDASKGKAIFSQNCVACHKINNLGALFGPELSEIGNKLPKDALYNAILYPSSGISVGFETYSFTLKNKMQFEGLIASETPDKLDIKFPGGSIVSYPKADIISKKQLNTSLMPANFHEVLTDKELADLVEYLSSLKKATN